MSSSTNAASPAKKAKVDRIGPFEIRQQIGQGSFATVYKGYKTTVSPSLPVAIKAVTRNKLTPKLLENLESEIRLLKGITHRNVVTLIDCLKTENHIYLIMGYCSAGDLSNYIKKRGMVEGLTESGHEAKDSQKKSLLASAAQPLYPHPKEGGLNEVVVRSFLGQLSDALKFLRSQNIIHRDLKPQNLLLQSLEEFMSSGSPAATSPDANQRFHPHAIPVLQVADFGFARFLPQASMAETLCGSPLYMAPEILRYERYDAKADLWSVGAVLYEMAVGRPPFRAQNHVELLRRIEKGEDRIKFPDERTPTEENGNVKPRPEVPQDLKELIRRLLKRNPVERMSFADFFVAAERACVSGAAAPLYASIEKMTRSTSSASQSLNSSAPKPLQTSSDVQPSVQRRSSFAPKYVTAPATPQIETSPVVSATQGRSSPARQNSRQNSNSSQTKPVDIPAPSGDDPAFLTTGNRRSRQGSAGLTPDLIRGHSSSIEDNSPGQPTTPRNFLNKVAASTAAVADDDSVLGTEYVVVEKRAVEVNALADEMQATQRRPSTISRQVSRGFLSRPAVNTPLAIAPVNTSLSNSPYPPTPSPKDDLSTTPPFALSSQRPTTIGYSSSPRSRPSIIPYSSSPRSLSYGISPLGGLISASPGTAIIKAINTASLKLFGNPADGILLRKPSARRKPLPKFGETVDPVEVKLVSELEDIGHKASVIYDFADYKLLQLLPATPQASVNGPSSLPKSSSPFNDNLPARRNSGSSIERPSAIIKGDTLAAEALILYIRALAFLQRGIEKARLFWESRSSSSHEASAEFNEAVQWLRLRFNECLEKADWVKSRTQDDMQEIFAEKLIYDRALEMSRAAAVNELMGDAAADCEIAYETALYMLYTIVDEEMMDDLAVKDDDRATVNKFIASIQGRLNALRKKSVAAS